MRNTIFWGLLLLGGAVRAQVLTLTIDGKRQAQRIDNIGASGCWYSEPIGRYWPEEKKEQIAQWLFSREVDAAGNPKGIGLSAWRFNIGGGTAEQGDSSGIPNVWRRAECWLDSNGRYDWGKQSGYQWFIRKAHDYGVEKLIGFSNTPPVFMTKNGLGYKTEKDMRSNLRSDKYVAYSIFLADVAAHFDSLGLHCDDISPVNEPQWAWTDKKGSAGQEGSSWRNEEIALVTKTLDSVLAARMLSTKILVTEAGQLNYLYAGSGGASKQVPWLFGDSGNLKTCKHLEPVIGAHSYFSEVGDSNLVMIRRRVDSVAIRYGIGYWETEYSMLGDGFREGTKAGRSAMDCALWLAKVVHTDLVVGGASAWQFWNSYEPGKADSNTRYYLIALRPHAGFVDGEYWATKGLWALGNYSRWVRPGMHRVEVGRSDGKDAMQAAQDVMVSTFVGGKQVVVVAINYTVNERLIHWDLQHLGQVKTVRRYVTDAQNDLKRYPQQIGNTGQLPPRSVTTFVMEMR